MNTNNATAPQHQCKFWNVADSNKLTRVNGESKYLEVCRDCSRERYVPAYSDEWKRTDRASFQRLGGDGMREAALLAREAKRGIGRTKGRNDYC